MAGGHRQPGPAGGDRTGLPAALEPAPRLGHGGGAVISLVQSADETRLAWNLPLRP